MCDPKKLYTSKSFRSATPTQRAAVSNGCGPQSQLGGIVPDRLLGLSVSCACDVHDWDYHEGLPREVADRNFYANMKIIIKEKGGLLMRPRLVLAWWYFRAVRRFGQSAYDRS